MHESQLNRLSQYISTFTLACDIAARSVASGMKSCADSCKKATRKFQARLNYIHIIDSNVSTCQLSTKFDATNAYEAVRRF